ACRAGRRPLGGLCGGSLFFFSSRRRHTRFSRDWSSDVCSSDLHLPHPVQLTLVTETLSLFEERFSALEERVATLLALQRGIEHRSEERRVGKEWGARWSPAPYKKRPSPARSEQTCSEGQHVQHR